jgi:hypothetical protein
VVMAAKRPRSFAPSTCWNSTEGICGDAQSRSEKAYWLFDFTSIADIRTGPRYAQRSRSGNFATLHHQPEAQHPKS